MQACKLFAGCPRSLLAVAFGSTRFQLPRDDVVHHVLPSRFRCSYSKHGKKSLQVRFSIAIDLPVRSIHASPHSITYHSEAHETVHIM